MKLPATWSAYNEPQELLSVINASFHNEQNSYGLIAIPRAEDFQPFLDRSEEAMGVEYEKKEDKFSNDR